jgi:hypothetical protein
VTLTSCVDQETVALSGGDGTTYTATSSSTLIETSIDPTTHVLTIQRNPGTGQFHTPTVTVTVKSGTATATITVNVNGTTAGQGGGQC